MKASVHTTFSFRMICCKCVLWFSLAALITCAVVVTATENDEDITTISPTIDQEIEERGTENSPQVRTVLECVFAADWNCVQVKTVRALQLWLNLGTTVEESTENIKTANEEVESKEGEGDEEEHVEHEYEEGDSDESPESEEEADPEVSSGGGKVPGHSLLDQLADALVDGVSAIFFADSEDESRAFVKHGTQSLDRALQQVTAGRKGGGHGHGASELIAVIMMLKSGLMSIGTGFSALIQLKSFAFTILGVVISAIRLYFQYKASYRKDPPPVIKIFQIHEAVHEHDEVHHTVEHQIEHYPVHHHHHPQSVHLEPSHYAHDRAYIAQKPAANNKKQKPTQQHQPIYLTPSRP